MNVYLLVPNTLICTRYKRPVDVMLILRYFPRASAVRSITTRVVPSSLTSENIVLSVLVERRSELWTLSWDIARTYKCHLHTPNTPSLRNVQHHKGVSII